MERTTSLEEAKNIFGQNFIGPEELKIFSKKIGLDLVVNIIPEIEFSSEELKLLAEDYLLILGASSIGGRSVNLESLRSIFGCDYKESFPCFYNQDWYLREEFFKKTLSPGWHLIRREIKNDSRGVDPQELAKHSNFPSAILSAWTFFVYHVLTGEKLWQNDYIWCSDFDANGDQIYVGRYFDPQGLSREGFSIHRYLKIRNNYGCADCR